MGLWTSFMSVVTGTDLAAEQAKSDAADAQLSQVNQQALDAGLVTQAVYDQSQADIAAGNASTGDNNVIGAVDAEAQAGLADGLNNVLTAPGKLVGAVGSGASTLLWGIIKSIPWWVYLAGAAALFVWMGGLEMIEGRLGKRK